MRIEILLSTYNGEKYLRELLDSLVEQDYDDYHITIRDDGSSDSTPEIIKEYEDKYRELITWLDTGDNLGYPDCFWYLLEHAQKADMYAFCDQDDVWKKDKLKSCSLKCKDRYKEEPILYVHDYEVSDGDLNIYDKHRLSDEGFKKDYPYTTVFYVMTQGFTMIINDKLRRRILSDKLKGRDIAHDRWTFWCGLFAGDIIYDDNLLAIYRRHEASVTETGKGVPFLIKDWWTNDVVGDRLANWCRVARYFAKCYHEDMDKTVLRRWMLISGGGKGLFRYFLRLFLPMKLKPSVAGEIVLRMCFLLNKK